MTDSPARSHGQPQPDTEVTISSGSVTLPGFLDVPVGARGIVIFAHGSGSSRMSPRNRTVARALNAAGIGTLLFDLLMPREEIDRRNVFDIPLLAQRLTLATQWVQLQPELKSLRIGYFGASTGAGAALVAAAGLPGAVEAVVSRGGRPDLAGNALIKVTAPTLLIVGGRDSGVIVLNSQAYDELRCERRMEIVPGATHLFEETGTLETVTRLAIDWFHKHLDVTSVAEDRDA